MEDQVFPEMDPVLISDNSEYSPEKSLWTSVLLQAVREAVKPPKYDGHSSLFESQMNMKRAREWFFASENHVGSFEWICMILNLDTERVRRTVKEMIGNGTRKRMKRFTR
ncbi:MAG: hypothetical protein HQL76_06060 [Magnetococcales bacterium]|nr:hypothetical protein [Magnetococcales bacterium]MBF0151738.1 hypothetical protein [Magnetococcales bacterium]